MPAVTRKDDNCTGHGCFPPRANNGGSGNVKTNSKPTHRKGDGWTPHGCPNVPPKTPKPLVYLEFNCTYQLFHLVDCTFLVLKS